MFLGSPCAGPGIAPGDDEIVTTFCDLVTPRCEVNTHRARRLDTKVMGEAMASASEFLSSGGSRSGAGAALVFLVALVLAACGSDARTQSHAAPPAAPRAAVADPAEGVTTDLDGVAPALDEGIMDELAGDDAAARVAYEKVLAASDAPAPIAARAALHLAQLEAHAGKARRALDLGARAKALAPADVAIDDGIAQLRADVVAASGTGDARPPAIGTALPGVDAKTATAFAAAERALANLHRYQPRPFDVLLGAEEDATEEVVSRYRVIAEHGGLAQVAADDRIGNAYQDLGLFLLFEPLPAQLEPSVAAGLRQTQRVKALVFLKRAAAAYKSSLAGSPSADSELWRLAAEDGQRGVLDVLREAGEGSATP
jgi:hypothetical protein